MDAKSLEAGYSNNFLLRKLKGYYELMKPRVMSLVIFTAFVGMFLAPGQITFLNSFLVIVAIALGAGSSAAINMWFDEDIDKTMERTKLRPIPLGIVSKNEALVVGILTGTISLILMQWFSNSLATSLLLFTILFYFGFCYLSCPLRRILANKALQEEATRCKRWLIALGGLIRFCLR